MHKTYYLVIFALLSALIQNQELTLGTNPYEMKIGIIQGFSETVTEDSIREGNRAIDIERPEEYFRRTAELLKQMVTSDGASNAEIKSKVIRILKHSLEMSIPDRNEDIVFFSELNSSDEQLKKFLNNILQGIRQEEKVVMEVLYQRFKRSSLPMGTGNPIEEEEENFENFGRNDNSDNASIDSFSKNLIFIGAIVLLLCLGVCKFIKRRNALKRVPLETSITITEGQTSLF